jgi:predicted RNA polymerase sigma factor
VTTATQQAIDAVWRIESARLIAGLARVVRDVGLAEDLAQDALVAALEQWPESGVPDVPGAWLMAVARRRGVDTIRRDTAEQGRADRSRPP